MTVIQKRILLVGSKGKEEVDAIFDTGSTYSYIKPELAEKLAHVEPLPEPMEFGTAKEGEKLTAKKAVRLNFYVNGLRLSDEFMLIDELSEKAVIGAATLQKWRIKLDFEKEEVIIDPRVTKLRLM
jgi:predicted aspartyl protease